MTKSLPLILLISITIISCQKGIDGDIDSDNNGNTPPTTTDTYQPISKDSYWKYKTYGTGITESTYTLTSTGQQQTFDAIVYNLFANAPASPGFENSFFGMKDHNYYTRAKGASPNTGAPFDLTFLYLNDTEAVGFQWNVDAGQGNGFSAKVLGKIAEKAVSVSIAGKTFANVIHTTIDLQYAFPGLGQVTLITYDYYVAKNIGIIRIISKTPSAAGSIETTTDLIEYSIK